jgi:DNA invertase Pin-like site-specific DNA recombinase
VNAPRKLRCAVYTRKSNAEGLQQDFNSLDAQREACESYIASQRSEGWVALRERYDDGGFSGGNMERPGLKNLLEDVRNGLVDVIVVYKIDRLSRSLADFAKLVELFDEHKVTFVSVTQSFSTTTSMGRLTLNILLSFAQFERELSGERVRDKIAASRQRGMWMGGMPPLGYDVVERKLVINTDEARLVREMFTRFAQVPSMDTLIRDLRARGVTSKSWTTKKGVTRPGRLIDKAYGYYIFNNPLYIGLVAYKGQNYPGQHEAIVTQDAWDRVQEHIKTGCLANKGAHAVRFSKAPSLLRGLLFSEQGRAFTPGYTCKGAKHYRYYVNTAAIKIGSHACEIRRLPAGEIEAAVLDQIKQVLRTPEILARTVREAKAMEDGVGEPETIQALRSIEEVWEELFPAEQSKIAHTLIERIIVRQDGVTINWRAGGFDALLRSALPAPEMMKEAA